MSGFTKGPWFVRRSLTGSDTLHISSDARNNIAAVTTEGDARLIAAAPDLLDALQMVRDYVVRMKGWGHGYQLAIDAAIAKATGEQA